MALVRATERGGSVVVTVSDDGPGVPPELLPHIFDRFYRATGRARRPGTGLGLAIVASIAAAHEGTVQAALNGPRGLRITLAVPAWDRECLADAGEEAGRAALPPLVAPAPVVTAPLAPQGA